MWWRCMHSRRSRERCNQHARTASARANSLPRPTSRDLGMLFQVLTSGDPYTIPQAGFNHAWNAHGGGAYLHEHLVDDYVSCWQQGLPNGETDASVCDHGTSRWFNYYLEGKFPTTVTVVVAAAPMRVRVATSILTFVLGAVLSPKVPFGRSIKHHTWTECELSNHCAEINVTRQH